MTTATQPKPKLNPVPAILVYGTPSSPELTQASWFRAEDKEAVKAAVEALKFSAIELQTDAEKALAVGVHEGVLKSSGRMIVGSVSSEVYRRIEEYGRKGASADVQSKPENATSAAAKSPADKPRTRSAPPRCRPPDPTSPARLILGRRCASARGFLPPTGTKSANSRASGSQPSSGSKPASSRSSGSTRRNIRRSSARRETSRSCIPNSASRASSGRMRSPPRAVDRHSLRMGRPSGRPSSFRALPKRRATPAPQP